MKGRYNYDKLFGTNVFMSTNYFGICNVISRLEADPAFSNVGSDEFMSKFVNHDVPVVAKISSAMVRLREKERGLEETNKLLFSLQEEEQKHFQKIREDEEYNRLSTGEYKFLYYYYYIVECDFCSLLNTFEQRIFFV